MQHHIKAQLLAGGQAVGCSGTETCLVTLTSDTTVTATFALNTYTLAATAGSGGSIVPAGNLLVEHGGSQAFTILPDEGYHIDDVLIDGVSIGAVGAYTFSDVSSDHTIEALFALNTYTVTATADVGGTISPSGAVTVEHGSAPSFAIAPPPGEHIADVLVDGIPVGAVETYTFQNITSDHTIHAVFPGDSPEINGKQGDLTIAVGDTYDFGNVEVGLSRRGTFTIENLGNQPLTVASIELVSDQFSVENPGVFPATLAPNASATFDIIFAPTAEGPHSATITLHSNDDNESQFVFTVVGAGINTTPTTFAARLGGTGDEYIASIQQTQYGGYIVAGWTNSFGAGNDDFWVLQLDSAGNIVWQKTYGGSGNERAQAIQETRDGGYIVAGATSSFGAQYSDIWVLKLNGSGDIEWQNIYKEACVANVSSIQQTTDNGYIVAGGVGCDESVGWTMKLDSSGNTEWQKVYTGTGYDNSINSIQQTDDGGYIAVGTYNDDLWIAKLQSNGNIAWQNVYGDSGWFNWEQGASIQQTSDSGYIVAGVYNGSGNSIWVLKLDSSGAILWQKTFVETTVYSEGEYATFIRQTRDGGYIVTGYTQVCGSSGLCGGDIWIIKLNSSGAIEWQKWYEDARVKSIEQTNDDGYIVAGETDDFGSDDSDFLLLKLDSNGNVPGCFLGEDLALQVQNTTITSGAFSAAASNMSTVRYATNASLSNTSVSPNYTCEPDLESEINVKQDWKALLIGDSYDFDPVEVGSTITESFTIENTGNDTLTITAIDISSVHFSTAVSGALPLSIAPDDSATFDITFTPIDSGLQTATVSITNNDSDENPYAFVVQGTAFQTYALTIHKPGNGFGTIVSSPAGISCGITCQGIYDEGTVITLTATPETGSSFSGWSGGGCSGTQPCAVTLHEDTDISATFTLDTYTIAATAGSGGMISPAGELTVNYGSEQMVMILPYSGYHIYDVLVDGTSVGAVESYTFSNVTANHTIEAIFAINTYTITATAGSGGSISPSGDVIVEYDAEQSFTITPDEGYSIATIFIDGTLIDPESFDDDYISLIGGTITFTHVTADHTVDVAFAINTYTITATAIGEGEISPSGDITVAYGTEQTFNMTPDTGYYLKDVLVDGSSVGSNSSYTLSNITSNHTIEAIFAVLEPDITVTQSGITIPIGGVYDFGTVEIGSNNSATFSITNTGEGILELTGSPWIQISQGIPDFQVIQQPATNSIEPGESVTFEVMFTPTREGRQRTTLIIENNDPGVQNLYTFILQGQVSGDEPTFAAVYGRSRPHLCQRCPSDI